MVVLSNVLCCACSLPLEGKRACETVADCVGGYACEDGLCVQRAGIGSNRTELPQSPALPDPARVEACSACAMDKCADERGSCLEDDACTELLACKGGCSDPACLQACVAEYGHSAWYDDYWACVFNDACTAPCGSGENFACVDQYDAPKTDRARFALRLRYKNPRTGLAYAFAGDQRDEQFAVGAEAHSCMSAAANCPRHQRIDTGFIDAMNTVELDVGVNPFTRNYSGMIEVEHKTQPDDDELFHQLGMRDRYLLPFLTDNTEFRMYVYWRGWIRDAVWEDSGITLNFEQAASLAVYIEDCAGAPARGVRIELPELPEARVLQQTSDGGYSSVETETGSALVGDVPLGDVPEGSPSPEIVVRAVQVKGERTIAERNTHVREGWITHLWLTPRAH